MIGALIGVRSGGHEQEGIWGGNGKGCHERGLQEPSRVGHRQWKVKNNGGCGWRCGWGCGWGCGGGGGGGDEAGRKGGGCQRTGGKDTGKTEV